MEKPAGDQARLKPNRIKARTYSLKYHPKNFLIGFDQSGLMTKLLNMVNKVKLPGVTEYLVLQTDRNFLVGIITGVFGYLKMGTEIVYLVGDGILKPFENQKRYDHYPKANAYTTYCNLVNGRGETAGGILGDSFGYKIR